MAEKLKQNWQEYSAVLAGHGITTLYHFTDRQNIESIIKHGGLYSWHDCDNKGITIAKPGGSGLSRNLDRRMGLQDYVRTGFVTAHPMMYVAMKDGRISNPVILEIDIEAAWLEGTKYADRNAAKNGVRVGDGIDDLKAVHFDAVKAHTHFDLPEDEQQFFQAEVLVKHFIPLKYIKNIGNFGIAVPSGPIQQAKPAYTAQITRKTPTAFIFLVDQSVSMQGYTMLNGERMSKSEAVARIVNDQIKSLVLRCIKGDEVRDYYDIAVIGYDTEARSAWKGFLEGRDFVSPSELNDNPYRTLITHKKVKTRKGIVERDVKEEQWIAAEADGSWTHVHKAFDKAKQLLEEWMRKHHDDDCYPPTIINITDGMFNGASRETVVQRANELKSMFTNDGNVILFNIHISSGDEGRVFCPPMRTDVDDNDLAAALYDLSSLLPTRYSADIARERGDTIAYDRYTAMAANVDMSTLIRLMDIGTPTNISASVNDDE